MRRQRVHGRQIPPSVDSILRIGASLLRVVRRCDGLLYIEVEDGEVRIKHGLILALDQRRLGPICNLGRHVGQKAIG